MTRTFTGGCLCGQVRYVATGEPMNVRVCHCGLCRRASGGMAFARAVFAKDALARSGEMATHASSARLLRHHCAVCHGLVYAEPLDRPTVMSIGLATLDDPDALQPDMHIWVSAKPAWLALNDGLPQYPEYGPPY
jgi:hypothetical protein